MKQNLIKCLKSIGVVCVLWSLPYEESKGSEPSKKWSIALVGDPKYASRNDHPEGVNIHAPKGGTLRQGKVGRFDNLSGLNAVGIPVHGLSIGHYLVYEPLMKRAPDEIFTLYGLLAESVQIASNHAWMIVHLHPDAKWSDGQPVTAKDVLFTYKTIKTHGRIRIACSKVKHATILSDRSIKFKFTPIQEHPTNPIYDRELPFVIAMMTILPEHFFKDADFAKAILNVGPGSGPYTVTRVDMGSHITFTKRPDYWGRNHTFYCGRYHFDKVQYNYYQNMHTHIEAFKSGEDDLLVLETPQDYKNLNGPAIQDGRIKKAILPHERSVPMDSFILNQRHPLFKDQRVRHAILLTLSWKKRMIDKHYLGEFFPITSYFQNTTFQAQKVFSSAEEQALEQGNFTPEDVHTLRSSSDPQLTNSQESYRHAILHATKLLKEAGWKLQQGTLVNGAGEPFVFEVLVSTEENQRKALMIKDLLKNIGVTLDVRHLDDGSYWERVLKYDFQSILFAYVGIQSPGIEQQGRWHSSSAKIPYRLNFAGIENALVDKLLQWIPTLSDREIYIGALRLLDRALKDGKHLIHLFYSPVYRVACWDCFGMPKYNPKAEPDLFEWWIK